MVAEVIRFYAAFLRPQRLTCFAGRGIDSCWLALDLCLMFVRKHQITTGGRVLSALAIGTVGLACKAFLNLGFCASVRVRGLDILQSALENEEEAFNGRGLITGKLFHALRR